MKVYKDNKGRHGKWRAQINGRWKTITATTEQFAVVEAERLLKEAATVTEGAWLSLVKQYLRYKETKDPNQVTRPKWRQTKLELGVFARKFDTLCDVRTVQMDHFPLWWDELTRYQQDAVKPEFNRFMKWGLLRRHFVLDTNPAPLLDKKEQPDKQRMRLTVENYRLVLDEAIARGYRALALAIQFSYATTMRRADILNLTFDNIQDGGLNVVVGKSSAQRGDVNAVRLRWDFDEHPHILELVKQCNLLSLEHDNCPYLISQPGRPSKHKTHLYQMIHRECSEQFTECSKAVHPGADTYPTFHEVRSLAGAMLEMQGVEVEEIRSVMAHTDSKTTALYLAGHERRFLSVKVSNQ